MAESRAWTGVKLWLGRRWRQRCDRRATLQVLVLGDSHVRVFEHWWFMWAMPWVRWHIVYVPGGTASGLYNAQSQTQAYAQFKQALTDTGYDWVLVNLGEVDTGHTIWARARQRQTQAEAMLDQALQRYLRFIDEVAQSHRVAVLGAPLPTLPDDFESDDEVAMTRRKAQGSLTDRTALTLAFNDRVAAHCAAHGLPHLDDRACSLGPDGRVRAEWLKREVIDHHYDRKTYARWLATQLKPLLNPPA